MKGFFGQFLSNDLELKHLKCELISHDYVQLGDGLCYSGLRVINPKVAMLLGSLLRGWLLLWLPLHPSQGR